MALLAEYAITPDVFDSASYSSADVCGLQLQALKGVLLHEGLVRNLRGGDWAKAFEDSSRSWHQRGKELLKQLRTQNRTVLAAATKATLPQSDSDWCVEALDSHKLSPVSGVITTDATAALNAEEPIVSSINRLTSTSWWTARSPSLRLHRTLSAYQTALASVLRHANSLIFIDPFFDPTRGHQYGDLIKILETLKDRSVKPKIEIHRAAWLGGDDKRPQVKRLVAALEPSMNALVITAGLSVEVFLWDDIHDRYLITDLIGISVPHGFGTTTDPNAIETTWTRLGRSDRDSVQRDFDPAHRKPRLHFTIS